MRGPDASGVLRDARCDVACLLTHDAGRGRLLSGVRGAQAFFEPTDEPWLEHRSPARPVFQAVVAAFKAFIETSGSAWLM